MSTTCLIYLQKVYLQQ